MWSRLHVAGSSVESRHSGRRNEPTNTWKTFTVATAAALLLAGGAGARLLAAPSPQAAAPEAAGESLAVSPPSASESVHAPFPGGARHLGKHPLRHRMIGAMLAAAARELGMTPKELVQELGAGKSLAQVAEAHGTSSDELKAAILDDLRAKLDRRVSAGAITRSQADALLSRVEGRLDDWLNKVWRAAPAKSAVPETPSGRSGT